MKSGKKWSNLFKSQEQAVAISKDFTFFLQYYKLKKSYNKRMNYETLPADFVFDTLYKENGL